MKKLNIILLFGLGAVVLSCSDGFLTAKQDYTGANEEVFPDPLRARAYVDYIYGMFQPSDGNAPQQFYIHSHNDDLMQTSDEAYGESKWNQEWAQISPNEAHAWDYIGRRMENSIQNSTYTRIRQINLFLTNVDEHDGIDEETKNHLKGQLY
ncbi:MAG TPA: hypothetical protein VK074_08710, partial [Fodinibius sp.]|nr:hypothetical protein [Fodinibius sp.]